MKILIIGSGGREHAITRKVHTDAPSAQLFCAPGNAGTAAIAGNLDIKADDLPALLEWARTNTPDLTIVGPEVPLCLGLVDQFQAHGLPVFGPNQAAARMEGSKRFAKEIMLAAAVPTARAATVTTADQARAAVAEFGIPVVLKADGLAAGKGVFVCLTQADADAAIAALTESDAFGDAAGEILVEQFLDGEEASMLAFVDGDTIIPMASSQDHKRLLDHDQGPNTGGMGAYSPAPCMTDELVRTAHEHVFKPVVAELKKRGIVYKGVLYAGLMLTADGPKVLEFNCRFGDPETQAILPRLVTPLVPVMLACINGTLDQIALQWTPQPCVCVVVVADGYPGKYDKGMPITGIADAEQLPGVNVFHAGTKLRDGSITADGGRVLGVTALAPTLPETVATVYRATEKIHFHGAQYRTDIAARALRNNA